jgi:hypothetical protein
MRASGKNCPEKKKTSLDPRGPDIKVKYILIISASGGAQKCN